jgi:hypothetical protein
MLAGLRGLAEIPGVNDPALFADVVVRLAELQEPPLRLPIGRDAQAYLSAAIAARLKEFEEVTNAGHHV